MNVSLPQVAFSGVEGLQEVVAWAAAEEDLPTTFEAQLGRIQELQSGTKMSRKLKACTLLSRHADMGVSGLLHAAKAAAQFRRTVETYERYGGGINGLSDSMRQQLRSNVVAIGTFDKPKLWKWGRRDCKEHIVLWQQQQQQAGVGGRLPSPTQTLAYLESGQYHGGLPSPVNHESVVAWIDPIMGMISELGTGAPITLAVASHGQHQARGNWADVGQSNWPVGM